ncbi:MAG: GDP-mannose 4,6-dehydratase [Candidatus Anstonellaceae archaeon]
MENIWYRRNVFITGATGFVGSHLAKRLINYNSNVIVLIRSQDPNSYFFTEGLNKKCILVHGDIRDKNRISEIIQKYEIETIFHLAAQPIVTNAILDPYITFDTNIFGTINILEASRKFNFIKEVIVASSDKAYGSSKNLPYREDMPLLGEAPYDVSKSCADLISLSYAKTYGLPISVSRCGNIYGPGDLNFSRIIPGAIKAALTNSTLVIRSDGKPIREYIFVDDVIDGYLLLAENIAKTKGEAFNFSSGEKLSVLEVIEKVKKILKKDIKFKILNQAKNEIKEQYLSYQKAQKILNWKPKFNINEGIKKTYPWYEKHIK